MIASRPLTQAAIGAAITVALIALMFAGRSSSRPVVRPGVDAGVQRTIAVFLVLDSAVNNTAAREAMQRVADRMRTSSGIRLVDIWVRPTADIAQLEDVLNASASIEAHPLTNNALDVSFRSGDSILVRRTYVFAMTAVDSIIAEATRSLDRRFATAAPTADPLASLDVYRRTHVADSLWKAGMIDAAEREYVATIALMPLSAAPRQHYAEFLYARDRTTEALRQARRAHELDPLSASTHAAYAALLERTGHTADAARERDEQKRIATILNPTPKDRIARARFKHVPKRPPRSTRSARPPKR